MSVYFGSSLVSPFGGKISVSGTYDISSNGVYDVKNYAWADVNIIQNPNWYKYIADLSLKSSVKYGGNYSFPNEISGILPSYYFAGTNLQGNWEFPYVLAIGSSAFLGCFRAYQSANLSFPLCSYIESNAFMGCARLSTVSFSSCERIASSAFCSCYALTTVSFPICTLIGEYAFYNCSSLTIVSFPSCVSIGPNAFYNCSSLTTVSFSNCVSIGNYAFYNCYSLTIVSFPNCSYIGTNAFCSCYNLLSFYLLGSSVPTLSSTNAFTSTPISTYTTSTGGVYGSIFVRASLYNDFITATNWATYSSRIVSLTDAQIAAL